MLSRFVLADLLRNPRRTLSTMVGVTLGVGLFCGVLFFVDGLSASMTQRAVAPLPIDMQRVVSQRIGGELTLDQAIDRTGSLRAGDAAQIDLEVRNAGNVAANEVTVRSLTGDAVRFVTGSARVDGSPVPDTSDNPFAHGAGKAGYNLGTIKPGSVRRLSYRVEARRAVPEDEDIVASSFSTREIVNPVRANQQSAVPLDELAQRIAEIDGVSHASQLSLADLGPGTLKAAGRAVTGPVKILGFDAAYADRDTTVTITDGELSADGAVVSAEAARAMRATIGDVATVTLPDGSTTDVTISGVGDFSRARSLFSSRRGGDLETFIYNRNSIVVSPRTFADVVMPAYRRAATAGGARLKNPPLREVDISLDRPMLDSDPATALTQTTRIGAAVEAVAAGQDYLLDNISNTLDVAAADAAVAKRLFVFLGVPGALLAAMLAAYAGSVLAEGQRREQATLRVRGAGRRHLLRMLALRTMAITAVGSVIGLVLGYLSVVALLGQESLNRASITSVVASALIGTLVGFLATGGALYVTGRRSIDREINEDRARLTARAPVWRRARLDVVGVVVIVAGTLVALRAHAFDGAAGSVYFGRSVQLNLALLVLPVGVWLAGSLLAARICGHILARTRPVSSSEIGRPTPSLFRLSVSRRPWAIANGAIVVSLIVGLAVNLAAFTASYDEAKAQDARYATGSDLRITPGPNTTRTYAASDADQFETDGVAAATPVIFGISNVIIRSNRTSDPANLAAIEPDGFRSVAPTTGTSLSSGSDATKLTMLKSDPSAVLVSEEMATFLKAKVGDRLDVLLVRATDRQVEVPLRITGLYERLPGFPEGVDAVMSLDAHMAAVPTKTPDFFLASAASDDAAGLQRAVSSLLSGPAARDHLQVDSRSTTLARDQSSLAALNIAGLVDLDATFALSMAVVAIAIFVFGLLLQRRREYVTLRAQGLEPRTIRVLIVAEAGAVAATGAIAGILVGAAMGYYFVAVLRPLFVLAPGYALPPSAVALPVALLLAATLAASIVGSRMVNRLEPTELLRDE